MHSTGGFVKIFHLSNYNFEVKDIILKRDSSLPASLERLRNEYGLIGQRQTVEAVVLVHDHNLPHVLLMQVHETLFLLPGGEVGIDENEMDALRRHLNQYLGSANSDPPINWDVVDMVANWWRPNFENIKYPYIPAHITKPKERTRLYLVSLPEKANFSVPKNLKLVAVPLLEIYENAKSYGHVISSLPQTLSRFNFNLL